MPQDFPSAIRLLDAGVRTVQVIRTRVNGDLAHVLMRWQEGGLLLTVREPPYTNYEPLTVTAPSRFRWWWYRTLVYSGLHRNSAGGFGSIVPDTQKWGGGGFG